MSSRSRISSFAVLAGLALGAHAADPAPLTGDAITAMVKGKRMSGDRKGASLRLRFGADGALSIQEGHAVETGRWAVEGDTLCLKVPKWSYDGCGPVVGTEASAEARTADGGHVMNLAK